MIIVLQYFEDFYHFTSVKSIKLILYFIIVSIIVLLNDRDLH